jgi:hypothetical protein
LTRLRDLQSSRKLITATLQTPQETLLGTPQTLPTSEPAAQIAFTVASGDLPTFSPNLATVSYLPYIIGAGKAVTAATIYWRAKKNSVSMANGNFAVAANTYYTLYFWSYGYSVSVGDLLEGTLWSNQTDSTYDYKMYQMQFTRPFPFSVKRNPILAPCNITTNPYPTALTLGNPAIAANDGFRGYVDSLAYGMAAGLNSFTCLHPSPTYGLGQINGGDAYGAYVRTHATYRPYYSREYLPNIIDCRALRI